MICEICGSQTIKKENGVFVCQECGTEYSIEDAKKLLTEVVEEKKSTEIAENNKSLSDFDEESKKLKLQYDLLCWHNFYNKCHELEKTFYITDKYLEKNVDITSRKISYDYENYYLKNVLPKFNDHYLELHPEILRSYNDEVDKMSKSNLKRSKAIEKAKEERTNAKGKIIVPFIISSLISIVLLIIMFSIGIERVGLSAWWVMLVFAGLFPFILVVCLSAHHIKEGDRRVAQSLAAKEYNIPDFDKWFVENVGKTETYVQQESDFKERFMNTAKKDSKSVIEVIPQLKKVKTDLMERIPLPEKYSDEQHVNSLLALTLDGRAETLKEAINLYETEAYRNTVVSSLQALNYNIEQLNSNISVLRREVKNLSDTTYQGFSALIQQNNYISQSLDAIRFDTRYLMIDNLLS